MSEEEKDLVETNKLDENILARIRADINPLITQAHSESLDVVEEMNKISLVTPTDVSSLSQAKQFVLESYAEVPSHRTLIQKQAGILTNGRFGSPDAKFWQCKKEAEVQFRELLRAHNKYRRGCVDIKEILYKIELLKKEMKKDVLDTDPILLEFDMERLLLKLEDYNINLKLLEKDIKYRIKEISDWHLLSDSYKKDLNHDEHNHAHHEIEAFAGILSAEMKKALESGNEKAVKIFKDQLESLNQLLTEKAKAALKEK